MIEFIKDKLAVKIFKSRSLMGEAVATAVANRINKLLSEQAFVNIIFGAALSQNDFFTALLKKDIDWSRLNAFQMDEYVNLDADTPKGFGNFLKKYLFDLALFHTVNYINGNSIDYESECLRYSNLLNNFETDIVCLGIGENTHLAFNDPHVADVNDLFFVKRVDLDQQVRTQQVNDGCFNTIDEVPTHALTPTLPALLKAPYVLCTVPTNKKAKAVFHPLNEEISDNYPSTLLRNHPNAMLFLNAQSSTQINFLDFKLI